MSAAVSLPLPLTENFMSSADPYLDPYAPRVARIVPGTRTYKPDWYEDHSKEDLQCLVVGPEGQKLLDHVRHPLKMRVADVMPSRRWAIGRGQDGVARVMTQSIFIEFYQRFISKGFNSRGEIVDLPGDPAKEPCPRVEKWIQRVPDPENDRHKDFGADPYLGVEKPASVLYDSSGENPRPIEEVIEDTRSPEQREGQTAVPGGVNTEPAPCGAQIRKGYVNVHRAKCKEASCIKAREEAA